MYNDGSRRLQDRFDTRRLADRLEDRKVTDRLSEDVREWIAARDMFFLATCDAEGWPTCSYKGGDPGFVRCPDDRTLAWPNYDGNGMYLSMGNILERPKVGLLFIDFAAPRRVRVEGEASLSDDPELVGAWPEAQFAVVLSVRRVYPNCPRYIHRMEPVERSSFVPRSGRLTPAPGWKRTDWAGDVLPAGDPALDPEVPTGG